MRYYPGKALEESHRSTLDEHPYAKRAVQEQIKRSRAQIAASEELLRRAAVGTSGPAAIPTAADCQEFAAAFRGRAAEPGTSERTVSVLRNISRTFSGLASQLAILEAADKADRSASI
ncbi:hypothetical protein ABIB66_006922 [Bradyrhizobium sp. F1.13.3]